MPIELVPVLNIGWSCQELARPNEWPYWNYPSVWEDYNQRCQLKKGYVVPMVPYLPGSTFYELAFITKDNLTRYTREWSQKLLSGEYNYEDGLSFPGGYVLKHNNQNILFPQCCGELSCIAYWERISEGFETNYFEGHPAPSYYFIDSSVNMDFSLEMYDDPFLPEPPVNKITFSLSELKVAVNNAKEELHRFETRLIEINENIGIRDIGRTLIWFNPNNTFQKTSFKR